MVCKAIMPFRGKKIDTQRMNSRHSLWNNIVVFVLFLYYSITSLQIITIFILRIVPLLNLSSRMLHLNNVNWRVKNTISYTIEVTTREAVFVTGNLHHVCVLCTFSNRLQQLKAQDRGRWHGPSITYKITSCWVTLLRQPSGPPCWASLLVFGLIGNNLEMRQRVEGWVLSSHALGQSERNNILLLYSAMLHLPPFRFHWVGGCWDWSSLNPGPLQRLQWKSSALTIIWLDLIHSSSIDLIHIQHILHKTVTVNISFKPASSSVG